eukprot:15344146-Ditylum_brightwellii.AAC.1
MKEVVGDKNVLKGVYLSTFQNSQNPSGKGISCIESQPNAFKIESAFPAVRPLWQWVQYCGKAHPTSNSFWCKKCPFQMGFGSFGV